MCIKIWLKQQVLYSLYLLLHGKCNLKFLLETLIILSKLLCVHSHPQRLQSFWSAPGIATSLHKLKKIQPGPRSRFLVPTKRSIASGDETVECVALTPSKTKSEFFPNSLLKLFHIVSKMVWISDQCYFSINQECHYLFKVLEDILCQFFMCVKS